MKKITFIVMGAGGRGAKIYSELIFRFNQELKDNGEDYNVEIVGVVEPNEERRTALAKIHKIDEKNVLSSQNDFFAREKFADVVIVATQDADHYQQTKLALELGYHILLEKPISNKLEECIALKKVAERYPNQMVTVCHGLRYTPFFITLKKVISSGQIGKVVAINHNENIGYYHFAHSFVRGNWRKKAESSPLILSKSCHDMDILLWLLDKSCIDVSAFGGLHHFTSSETPVDGGPRCLSCSVEQSCSFSARQIYLEKYPEWQYHFTNSYIRADKKAEEILKTSPYGRCVYQCDNDVLDHMSISLNFEDGVTALFSLSAFTSSCCRTIKVMGTKGEIRGHMEEGIVEVSLFGHNTKTVITPEKVTLGEHGGGDWGLIVDFCKSIIENNKDSKTSLSKSLESHIMSFAVDESYTEKKIVNIDEFYKKHSVKVQI